MLTFISIYYSVMMYCCVIVLHKSRSSSRSGSRSSSSSSSSSSSISNSSQSVKGSRSSSSSSHDNKNKICYDHKCINYSTQTECITCHDEYCYNQRFKKKEYANLYVKHTIRKGYGLFTNEDLKKSQFLMEYVGMRHWVVLYDWIVSIFLYTTMIIYLWFDGCTVYMVVCILSWIDSWIYYH